MPVLQLESENDLSVSLFGKNSIVNGQTVKSFLELNKVPYKTSGGFFSMEKSTASIAEEAHKWTVLVECWK
jgi:hypothetical protein